ncbi:hypothetical protein ACOME3_009877 [Neoechinorhynchus agilis]
MRLVELQNVRLDLQLRQLRQRLNKTRSYNYGNGSVDRSYEGLRFMSASNLNAKGASYKTGRSMSPPIMAKDMPSDHINHWELDNELSSVQKLSFTDLCKCANDINNAMDHFISAVIRPDDEDVSETVVDEQYRPEYGLGTTAEAGGHWQNGSDESE